MPDHVVRKIAAGLNRLGKSQRGARVLVLGVAFKRDIDDARNSQAQRVIELLLEGGATVAYHDPYVPHFRVGGNALHPEPVNLASAPLNKALAQSDAVVIITGHSNLDYAGIVARSPIVIDTVNATRGVAAPAGKIIYLGAPMPA